MQYGEVCQSDQIVCCVCFEYFVLTKYNKHHFTNIVQYIFKLMYKTGL